jgi:hypothetical protein
MSPCKIKKKITYFQSTIAQSKTFPFQKQGKAVSKEGADQRKSEIQSANIKSYSSMFLTQSMWYNDVSSNKLGQPCPCGLPGSHWVGSTCGLWLFWADVPHSCHLPVPGVSTAT